MFRHPHSLPSAEAFIARYIFTPSAAAAAAVATAAVTRDAASPIRRVASGEELASMWSPRDKKSIVTSSAGRVKPRGSVVAASSR